MGLGVDAMSVCMGIGVKWHGRRQKFRLVWHMGLFQFLMPLAGWLAGSRLAGLLQSVGTPLAAGLVFAIGAKMLWEAIQGRPGAAVRKEEQAVEKALHFRTPVDPTRGWSLVVLSVATSLDALVMGVSLGLKDMEIWETSLLIGLTAGAMSLAGVVIGKHAGKRIGRWAEVGGAILLMGLGVSFLWAPAAR